MVEEKETFFVTTPIYYVNAVPHIGHAYSTIVADVLSRFERLRGKDVFFLTGTDENAPKVAAAARQQDRSPREYCDELAARFREVWDRLRISCDDFIRTTEERHKRVVQRFVEKLYETGDIYVGTYAGWYCLSDETFFDESELVGGRCPNQECRREVQWVEEPTHYFRLSAYADRLLAHIEANPGFLAPEVRRNEVVSFIRSGLRDVCISRKLDWGIPIPSSVPGSEDHVVYVWFDALINYISALGYLSGESRLQARFERFWPADLHLVAKDIFTRFHATLWPALLMAAGLPLPKRVFGHGFWTFGEEKMSKSRGNVVEPVELAEDLVAGSGCTFDVAADAIRYYLLREVTFGVDGAFSQEALVHRYNSDLANDLGNLLNRTLSMAHRYCDGRVPNKQLAKGKGKLREAAERLLAPVSRGYEDCNFTACLDAVWEVVSLANGHIESEAPWEKFKRGDQAAVDRLMGELVDALQFLAVALTPVMPSACTEIRSQLGAGCSLTELRWPDAVNWSLLAEGSALLAPEPVFPRIEKASAEPQPIQPPKEKESKTVGETITFQEFQKVDLRVARIKAAELVPGADKLLRIVVDDGEGDRQIVAGIAQQFPPDTLVGKEIVLVANLAPVKIRGVESNGMLLAAGEEIPLALVTLDREVPEGTKIR